MRSTTSGAMPIPVSATANSSVTASAATSRRLDRDRDRSAFGELHGVADEVGEDLPDRDRIADQHRRHSVVDVEHAAAGPFSRAAGLERGHHVVDQLARRERRLDEREAAGFRLAQLEHAGRAASACCSDEDLSSRTKPPLRRRRARCDRAAARPPMIALSGLRMSWLSIASRSALSLAACSALRRASSSSRS